jgi:hypothetical protein
VVKADGKSMFDGYFVAMSGAPTPINQCASALPQGDPRRVIGAVGVPVVHVMSQSDYLGFVPQRRVDSDTQADRYRHYDLAGAGHATPDELYYAARPADIQKGGRPVPAMDCNEGPRSRFPSALPMNAILRNLEAWVEKGTPPPPSQNIVVKDGAPVLDSHGNVTGGVRSPYLDAPTSVWSGSSTGQSFCFIAGHEKALERAELKTLYPTHAVYVAAVQASIQRLARERFVTREDGEAVVAEAKRAAVP